ncbi:glycosyltransferase [Paenibacillus sp.]|jgi:glycosyltransferase involved in cell wall biosynthesis|uniref:glycosyltransferase n=1 Tax=Paenibacillus sp. TaxID=58172 RepID=UPI002836327B|nr:glycosyltransferase [Paenibacillus sp.]MDR0268453.1 glycosyltransferase [Paenibacillus sp.]
MRVLYQTRYNIFTRKGGDTVQLLKTKEFIENRFSGIRIDINSDPKADLSAYDLVHVFNMLRPQETILFINNAKDQHKKVALSTIFWRSAEFERQGQIGLRKMINRMIRYDDMEKLRALYRYYIDGEKHEGTLRLIRQGYTRLQREILDQADLLLPNGVGEVELIRSIFKPAKQLRYLVVPNAIDARIFSYDPKTSRETVLCVGRFEPRKNQLNLIRAFNDLPYKLILAGTAHETQRKYFEAMKKAIRKDNIEIMDEVDHRDLQTLYERAKVHVLPSWYDTPGLVSLEAAVSGCNIVATTRGTTTEYFGDDAFYCEPGDVESIRRAVTEAFGAPYNERLQNRIISEYTWERAADLTVQGYERLLGLNDKEADTG